MIASLPMYDRPETAAAQTRLWAGIRDRLGHGPATLTRSGDPWSDWTDPALLLSQTCGLPYRARLHGRVRVVAAPVWDLDCPAGRYHSVLVSRSGDRRGFAEMAGAVLAYNDPLSQSGWAAPAAHAMAAGIAFGGGVRTGSHRGSAAAVADGQADLAAIDAVSWAMIRRWDAAAAGLREIGRTAPTPAPPYITATGDPETLRRALSQAVAELSAQDYATLCLRGITSLPAEHWLAVPIPVPPPAGWTH